MRITKDQVVFTTACVTTPEKSRAMMHWMQDSCEMFGIDLRPYGISLDAAYRGWTDIKVNEYEKAAPGWIAEGFTHVFYSDARDSFMLTGADEIVEKYNALGCPPYLVSAEDQPYPFHELGQGMTSYELNTCPMGCGPGPWLHIDVVHDEAACISCGWSGKKMLKGFPDPGHPWRYIGAGQYMCEIEWSLEMWGRLRERYDGKLPREDHDQGWLQMGWAEGMIGEPEFRIDTSCVIFQTGAVARRGGDDIPHYIELKNLEIRGDRIYNPFTKTRPCAAHWPGGFSSPITGKDHTIKPIWDALGFPRVR